MTYPERDETYAGGAVHVDAGWNDEVDVIIDVDGARDHKEQHHRRDDHAHQDGQRDVAFPARAPDTFVTRSFD